MKITKHDPQTEMEMNMTPMIDVVFLLIIFFMIITDMTQQDLEELKLPVAQSAIPDEPDPKVVRPVINILHDGTMIVKRETLYDPETEDLNTMKSFLADQARLMPQEFDEAVGAKLPDNPILIRADQNTEFKHIQRIMEICGQKGIQIWKIELAAAEDEKKKKQREESEGE